MFLDIVPRRTSFPVCVLPYSQCMWCLIPSLCATLLLVYVVPHSQSVCYLTPSFSPFFVALYKAGSEWVSCLLTASSLCDSCVHHIWLDCSWRSFRQIHCYSAPGAPTCPPSRQGIHDQNTEEKGKDQRFLILCQLLK